MHMLELWRGTPFLLLVVFRFRPLVRTSILSKILNIEYQRVQNWFSGMGNTPDEVFVFLPMTHIIFGNIVLEDQ